MNFLTKYSHSQNRIYFFKKNLEERILSSGAIKEDRFILNEGIIDIRCSFSRMTAYDRIKKINLSTLFPLFLNQKRCLILISIRHLVFITILRNIKEVNEIMRFLYPKYRRYRLTAQRAGGGYNDQSNHCSAA